MPKKKTSAKKTYSDKEKIQFLSTLALIMAVAAVAFSVTILVGMLINNSSRGLSTSIVTQSYSSTDDSRGVVPQNTNTSTEDSRLSEPGSGSPSTGSRSTTGTSSSTRPASTSNTSSAQRQVAPAAGLPENIIIFASVILGLIGSATFIALRKGV